MVGWVGVGVGGWLVELVCGWVAGSAGNKANLSPAGVSLGLGLSLAKTDLHSCLIAYFLTCLLANFFACLLSYLLTFLFAYFLTSLISYLLTFLFVFF